MSKIELLIDVVNNLTALADSIQAIVDTLQNNESVKVAEGSEKHEAIKEAVEKQITLEEVRTVLAEKSHDGFTAEVRGLLQKYGASKLSEVNPNKYDALLKDAEDLK